MAARKPHQHIHNLGAFAHPPKAGAKAKPAAKVQRTHLDHPKTPEKAKVVTGRTSRKPAAPKTKSVVPKVPRTDNDADDMTKVPVKRGKTSTTRKK